MSTHLLEKAAMGKHAEHLVADEVFQRALEMAREEATKEWLESEEREAQFAAWAKHHAISAVEKQLRRIISDGQHAQELIARQQ